MRGREFLMKDAYSFAVDYEGAKRAYNKMFVAYLRTFDRLGLKAIPMAADTGPIGGDMSHEFIILAETGESQGFCHKGWMDLGISGIEVDFEGDLQPVVDKFTSLYAATDEKHVPADCPVPAAELIETRGIEVGHIFYFASKYSEPLKAEVQMPDGSTGPVHMGSYGIGVSRLVAAIIEQRHDDKGIVWPASVAPFTVVICPIGMDRSAAVRETTESLYAALQGQGLDVLLDDRGQRPGAMFADAELIGIPYRIVIGDKALADGQVEFKARNLAEAERVAATAEAVRARIAAA